MDGLFGLLEGSLSDISTSDEEEDETEQHVQETTVKADAFPVSDDAIAPKKGNVGADATSKSVELETAKAIELTAAENVGPSKLITKQKNQQFAVAQQMIPILTSVTDAVTPLRSVVDLSKLQNSAVTDDCNIETPLPADSVETLPVCLQ